MTVDKVTAAVAAAIAGEIGRRWDGTGCFVVGVSGIDCSGKSVFAERLREQVGTAPVLHGDDFHRPKAARYREPDAARAYYYHSFDYERLGRLLARARRGEVIDEALPVVDPLTDEVLEKRLRLAPPLVLIVEGVFLYRPELVDLFDLRIVLRVDDDVAIARARVRDGHLEDVAGRYRAKYLAGQRLYEAEADALARADVVVDNNDFAAPWIVAKG